MRTFFKGLGILLAVVVLLVLVILLTLGWWLPPLAESQARKALNDLGLEPVELTIERMGYSGVTLTGLAVETNGSEVSLRSLTLDYSLIRLFVLRQADNMTIEGLDVTAYLPPLLENLSNSETQEDDDGPTTSFAEPLSLPEQLTLPVKSLYLNDSSLTLETDGWRKRLELSAFVEDGQPIRYFLEAADTGDSLSISGTLHAEHQQTDATFKLLSEEPLAWLGLVESLELAELPEGIAIESGPFELEGALVAADMSLDRWTSLGSLQALKVKAPQGDLTLDLFNFGANGQGMLPEKLWGGVFTGKIQLAEPYPVTFNWDAATLETIGDDRTYLKIEDWRLNGNLAALDLGSVSLKAGPIRALLDGPWATVHGERDLQPFAVKIIMSESPIELFTDMASLLGKLGVTIQLSPAAPERDTEATITLKDATLETDAATLSLDALSLAITGSVPRSLSARVEVENASASWADGSGQLEGVNGELTFDDLMRYETMATQTLTYTRFSQGKIVVEDGTLTFSLSEEAESDVPLLTITAGGEFAAGRIALRVVAPLQMDERDASIDLLLQNVSLSQLARLFPEFDGKIQGRVSGELPIRIENNRIVLRPGYLEMAAGETGKFSYARQGWLTQDPSLNPTEHVKDKQLHTLMQEPNGGAILTELALRDLNMTAFRMDILKPGQGDRRVIIRLEGDGELKGTKIPIVQDIRIGGDVKEAVNLMLKANEKIEFSK